MNSLPSDITLWSDVHLLDFRARLEVELGKRGIVFNVGLLGERLAIEFFNRTPGLPTLLAAPPGTKNVDALSRDGERYSIKSVMKAKKTGTVYPDKDDPERQLFEWMLIVQLSPEYALKSIHAFSWQQFYKLRKWDRRMNAWYLGLSAATLTQGKTIATLD